MQLFLLQGCKLSGNLDVKSFKAVRCCTFFDLIFKNRLNIVQIVGVDFSMANLTMDDTSFCNHSLKPGAPNDYISCLKATQAAYAPLSEFKMAYGFGARTLERGDKSQAACDLFSMSGDMQDTLVHSAEEMIACYYGTLK